MKCLWNIISKQHKCDEKIKMMKIFTEENKTKELEGLHHHTFSNMFFMLNFYHVLALRWALHLYLISFPNLLIIFPSFFHSFQTWLGLLYLSITCLLQCVCIDLSIASIFWCVCTHPINLISIHLLRCTHGNPWCNSWHFCHHCDARCWLPCGTRTITCTFINHIQLFLLTSQHCDHQKMEFAP